MEFQLDQTFKISSEVLFQEVSGELVLLDIPSGKYFGLDEVGARIWSLLKNGSAVGAVLESLEQEYDVGRPQLEADVDKLLASLTEAGLVVL